MTKPEVGVDAAILHIAEVEENNARVRAKAPKHMLPVMDEVQSAIDAENAELEARHSAEQKLRQWAEGLCNVPLDMSEIEELRTTAQQAKAGSVLFFIPKRPPVGQEERVPVALYKTVFGVIDRVEKYLFALESTIIDLTSQVDALTALPKVSKPKRRRRKKKTPVKRRRRKK